MVWVPLEAPRRSDAEAVAGEAQSLEF